MSLLAAFEGEMARTAGTDGEMLLPDRLAAACTAVLPFRGAGLSMTMLPDRRLPLGASDPVAAAAERLQFALGEGPCMTSQRTRMPVVATTAEHLQRVWPLFAHQLVHRTPYRGVVCLPVGGPLSGVAALDLYRDAPGELVPGMLDTLVQVADAVGVALGAGFAVAPPSHLGLPAALNTAPVDARHRVWSAIGYLSGVLACTGGAALATLRALAFSHDLDLEVTADRVLSGELTIDPDD